MIIYSAGDARPSILREAVTVVLGYGNQGRPQALNLRDSGFNVKVAARRNGNGWDSALADGFEPLEPAVGAAAADLLLFLVPDEVQGEVFRKEIDGNLRPGAAVSFAHGFAVAFGEIATERYDLILVAPKGQGGRLREAYLEGSGLPCLIAVENDVSGKGKDIALALSWGLGCLRVGGFETSFKEEAVSDIFGEQAVLCGGVPAIVKKAYELLVRKGFSPEIAYFECLHELKIIVDLFTSVGFSGMRDVISGTAAYGGLRFGEKLIAGESEREMEALFARIESGEFARDWLAESAHGAKTFEKLRRKERELSIESVGKRVRKMYPKGKGR